MAGCLGMLLWDALGRQTTTCFCWFSVRTQLGFQAPSDSLEGIHQLDIFSRKTPGCLGGHSLNPASSSGRLCSGHQERASEPLQQVAARQGEVATASRTVIK